ncbi:methyltransferase family protein [Geobacter sulfurreducens]|uniref:methyltransferase family protein n=1 Tax=Geobacter sulfurreducens TaxID=35554 RepID=UPI0025748B35|nr:isoprenylcysteine carboxylmethyltransferase family protein [Geobacter sulfurreducens]BEH09646.1 hypothetical protein GSUET_12580 [Geobacter sulfurreducens subsp. ethanolicus]HML78753.1 isoprenylcysteine carboxylmethyltransferase family protein [Geobacter sulfurreducens]
MKSFMIRYAMTVSAGMFCVLGLLMAGDRLLEPVTISVIVVLFAWAAIEFLLGRTRPVEGIVPSHRLIGLSRAGWVFSIIYSWLDVRHGWTHVDITPSVAAAMLLLCLAALILRFWAIMHLGPSFTYDVKRPQGNALVQTGPYRLVRHPGYLGIVFLATVPGLAVGSLAGFAGLLATTLVQTIIRINAEDRMLEENFGEAFREYARKTRRLLPYLY